ncbi:Lipoprotein [Kosakonia sp. BK9b]
MKFSLLLLLLSAISTARADDAIKLICPTRGALTVSFFNYHLITMKWGDHFQVASGKEQNHTKAGVPFWSTTFGNGDDLAFFPDSGQYYLFYAGAENPERCSEVGSYVYPVITPPRYENNGSSVAGSQAKRTDDDVVLLHPAA